MQTESGGACGMEEAAGDGAWRGRGAVLRGTDGGEVEWRGRMGTATQGGNGAASIETRGQDERIGSLDERRVRE